MGIIEGITITLYDKREVGKDPFHMPIYEEIPIIVENVLVVPASATDIVEQYDVHGKKAVYTLGIPKNDQNEWEDRVVEFFNQKWRTFGFPTQGIDELIPLEWNKKVMVERYG